MALSSSSMFFAIVALLAACTVSEGPPNDGNGADNGDDCSCTISSNGASRTIACGTDTCLGGQSVSCGAGAKVTRGGTCSESPSTPETGTGLLTCASVGLCTNWRGTFSLDEVPPLTGGTIEDGMYRTVAGTDWFLVFEGKKVLRVNSGRSFENTLGSWAANGDTITFTNEETCTSTGTSASTEVRSYKFKAEGDDLFLQVYRDGKPNGSPAKLRRVSSFCAAFPEKQCANGFCACKEVVGEPLPSSDSCDP